MTPLPCGHRVAAATFDLATNKIVTFASMRTSRCPPVHPTSNLTAQIKTDDDNQHPNNYFKRQELLHILLGKTKKNAPVNLTRRNDKPITNLSTDEVNRRKKSTSPTDTHFIPIYIPPYHGTKISTTRGKATLLTPYRART